MANFSMTCACGDVMTVDAPDREAAVGQFKGMMDASGIEQHFQAKHAAGEQRPTVEQAHGMIEQTVAAA